VEYRPDSWEGAGSGKFMPPARISDHIMHVGVLVGDREKSMSFYHGVLGFNQFWRGSSSPRMLRRVNMRVPESDDYLEFMLYSKLPPPDGRGTKNHMSLMVPDAQKAVDESKKRAAGALYLRPGDRDSGGCQPSVR
jgi:lactoylglutathione lyase